MNPFNNLDSPLLYKRMEKKHDAQTIVITKFPDYETEILQCMETDALFAEMCVDYAETYQAYQLLQAAVESPELGHREAFAELLHDLEQDLRRYFQRNLSPKETTQLNAKNRR